MKPSLTTGEEKRWTVFVDGAEINGYLLDFETACKIAQEYSNEGYKDVSVYQYDTGEELRI